ncbi:MAG: hypothetical protein QOE01_2624, partial [Actinomycetota bacterium]|nr:hypothetical protein [Actinomycetota bacterium]
PPDQAGPVAVELTTDHLDELGDALAGNESFALDVERTRAVRGMGLVRPGVVRRPPPTGQP